MYSVERRQGLNRMTQQFHRTIGDKMRRASHKEKAAATTNDPSRGNSWHRVTLWLQAYLAAMK